jgi:hypothetical protein
MVVDVGKSEIFKGQVSKTMECSVGGYVARFETVKYFPDLVFGHSRYGAGSADGQTIRKLHIAF